MELKKFPHHPIYIEQDKYSLQNYLVFELITRDRHSVYMKHPIYKSPNNDVKIVFLRDYKFLKLWQNSLQEPQLSFGNETHWRNDRKFHYAEEGFRQGRDNPVPLAELHCGQYVKRTAVFQKRFLWLDKQIGFNEQIKTSCSFVNGITRTIWLLANGVHQFPVYIDGNHDSQLLAQYAGIHSQAYYGVAELNLELERLFNKVNLYEPLSWQE